MKREPERPFPLDPVARHVERHLGPVDFTLRELGERRRRVSIHHVSPSEREPFHALVTSGLSTWPMKVPPGRNDPPFAELFLLLPPWWRFDSGALGQECWRWPLSTLRELARRPFEDAAWIGCGHVVRGVFPSRLGFRGSLLTFPVSVPGSFARLRRADRWVYFYQVVPLYEEEMDFTLEHSTRALVARFCQYQIEDVVAPGRRNVGAPQPTGG